MHTCKGVFKGGGGLGGSNNFLDFLGESEGTEVERKRKKGMGGGGRLIVNIFYEWGSDIFRGVEKFSRGGG